MIGRKYAKECKEFIKTTKWKIFGKSEYGKIWNKLDPDWWHNESIRVPALEEDLKRYISSKKNIHTILDVGCGAGAIPTRHKDLFSEIHYTGIDISEPAILHCKKNLPFEFICGDFIKMEVHKQHDLVFSLGMLDHVYDIDKYLTKTLDSCKKYAYIHSYGGYFTELKQHKQKWSDGEGCYYNHISIQQAKKFFINYGLKESEFTIRSLESENGDIHTIFEIEKKN